MIVPPPPLPYPTAPQLTCLTAAVSFGGSGRTTHSPESVPAPIKAASIDRSNSCRFGRLQEIPQVILHL